MNNPANKKYKRYIVILSENYDKLLAKSIVNEKLSAEEKQLISILNNTKLEPHKRLVAYQQILFAALNKRADEYGLTHRQQLSNIGHSISNTRHPLSTNSHLISNKNYWMMNPKTDRMTQTKFDVHDLQRIKASNSKRTEKGTNTAQTDYEHNFENRFGSPDVGEIFSTPAGPRLSSTFREDYHESMPVSIDDDDAANQSPDLNKAYDDIYADDPKHFDASREKQNVIEQIERLSTSGTPDFRNMTFKNLGDPSKK